MLLKSETEKIGDIPCTPVLDDGNQVDTLGIFYRMPVTNGVAIARASEFGIEEAVTCYAEGSARRAFCEQLVDEANWLFHTDIEGKTQPFMTAGLKIDAKDKVYRMNSNNINLRITKFSLDAPASGRSARDRVVTCTCACKLALNQSTYVR